MIYVPKGICLTNFIHDKPIYALCSENPNGDAINTPLICLYKTLLNIKYDSFSAKDRRPLNSLFSNHE